LNKNYSNRLTIKEKITNFLAIVNNNIRVRKIHFFLLAFTYSLINKL